jgi:hypothetical protein
VQLVEANSNEYATLFPASDELLLDGYFQHSRYVEPIYEELRWLVLQEELPSKLRALSHCFEHASHARSSLRHRVQRALRAIRERSANRALVLLHLRRGDDYNMSRTQFILPDSYYRSAIATMQERLGDSSSVKPFFVLFSDNVASALDSLSAMGVLASDVWVVPSWYSDVECLLLMAELDAAIIANSSFSWWGAFLQRFAFSSRHLVVAPRVWWLDGADQSQMRLMPHWISI